MKLSGGEESSGYDGGGISARRRCSDVISESRGGWRYWRFEVDLEVDEADKEIGPPESAQVLVRGCFESLKEMEGKNGVRVSFEDGYEASSQQEQDRLCV